MPSYTPNYNLALYNSTTDNTQLFLDYRTAQAGPAISSNMYLIDTAMADLQDQIDNLATQKGLIKVYAEEDSANVYSATGITGIVSYVTNTTIILALETSITGSATVNINSLGAKTLKKINSSGVISNLASGDLLAQRFFLFTYDGTYWIWDNAISSDQINVPSGVAGNFLRVATDKSIEDSGYDPTDFATAAQGVTNGNTHDHVGGDGAQIDYTGLSNLPSYKQGLFIQEDFVAYDVGSTSINPNFRNGVLLVGTFTNLDAVAEHNGILRFNNPATGNSGGYITTGTTTVNSIMLSQIAESNFIFRVGAITTTSMRLGFQDGYTTAAPTDGAWINISAATLDGRTANNTTTSTTGTSYTISASTWYRANISINAGATLVTFSIYDMSNTLLWTNTLSANIPTARATNWSFFAIRTAATLTTGLLDLDYADYKYSQTR